MTIVVVVIVLVIVYLRFRLKMSKVHAEQGPTFRMLTSCNSKNTVCNNLWR